MLEIASMLEEKNISDVHKWAPLHGTRVHKARRDKNKSPADQIVDGEAIDNMVILGESGVGKSESIEYMLKIREKILLLYEVIKELPE
jgi:ABC-type transport system involved in cytochrome bd biosynthesis fused ATPase/permease subunit